jgi:hypothetical protein
MLAGRIGSFADGFGDFVGLAETDADLAFAVTNDEERAEAEAATALDDFGASVNKDDLLEQIGFVLVATRSAIATGAASTSASTLAAARTATAISAAIVSVGRGGSYGSSRNSRCGFRRGDNRVNGRGFFGKFLFNNRIGLGGHKEEVRR